MILNGISFQDITCLLVIACLFVILILLNQNHNHRNKQRKAEQFAKEAISLVNKYYPPKKNRRH
jgi:hypothetical protein